MANNPKRANAAVNAKTGTFQLCTLHMMANQMTVLDTRVIASSIQVAHVGEDVPAAPHRLLAVSRSA